MKTEALITTLWPTDTNTQANACSHTHPYKVKTLTLTGYQDQELDRPVEVVSLSLF